MSLNHPAKDQLIAFGQGKLAGEESSQVEQHLEVCRECCETLLDLKDDTFVGLVRIAKPEGDDRRVGTPARPAEGASDTETDQAGAGKSAHPTEAVTVLVQSGEPISPDELPPELAEHPRYRIVELIGRGGMGNVYRAEHRLMNRAVAIKLINSQLVQHPHAVERFRREVQAAAKLSHPNIVAAYDAEQAGNAHFLVMEFVEGTDLASVVKQRGPMSVAEACECIRQAAVGLQHAHEKGMVHRDIKPHNLMLAAGGQVRILDFGLAGFASLECGDSSPLSLSLDPGDQRMGDKDSQSGDESPHSKGHLTTMGSVMGTPDYMAPEQAKDAHSADIRADIYSLGCTLHFLLTGKPPFEANNVLAKLKAHAEQPPPSLTTLRKDVPAEVSKVIARMMAKKPAERFQTPAAVAEALAPFSQSAQTPPRRRTLRAMLAAAAVILLAGVIFITTDKGRVEIRSDRDDVELVILKGGTEIKAVDLKTGTQVLWLPSGEYNVVLRDGDFYINLEKSGFKLSRWGKEIVTVKRIGGDIEFEPKAEWDGWSKDAPSPAIAPFNAVQAKQHQEAWAKHLGMPVEYTNSIGMKFRLIPPGEFLMGSTPEEIAEGIKRTGGDLEWNRRIESEGPKHRVILARPFYLGIHEVTQRQFESVMGTNPSHFSATGEGKDVVARLDTSNHPAERVSWNAAAEFCFKLSEQENLKPFYTPGGVKSHLVPDDKPFHVPNEDAGAIEACAGYRLPTEAEWDAGGRAGTTTKYWLSDNDDELRLTDWCGESSAHRTYPVGQLKANPYGLFDIHGNVWEWVHDGWEPIYYANFHHESALNPTGPPHGPKSAGSCVLRGGDYSRPSRATSRFGMPQWFRDANIGFRVALPVEVVKQKHAKTAPGSSPPLADSQILKRLEPNDPLARLPGIGFRDGEWKITASGPGTVVLFDIPNPNLGDCGLRALATVRTQGLTAEARLELRIGVLTNASFGSAVWPLNNQPNWSSLEVPYRFALNKNPPWVQVALNFKGAGTVWVKDVSLLRESPQEFTRRNRLAPVRPNTATGINLLMDSSFEVAKLGELVRSPLESGGGHSTSWSAWLTDGPDFRCEVVEGGRTGKQCLQVAGTGTRGVVFGHMISLDRSKRYALKGWVKFASDDKAARAIIKFNYFQNVKWLGATDLVGASGDQNDWLLLEKTDAADSPAEATLLVPTCHVEGNGTASFDDLEVIAYDRDKLPADFDALHGKHNPSIIAVTDEQRLQGKWVAVSGHARKQPIPAEQLVKLSIAFDGEQVTIASGDWNCSMHPRVRMPKPGKCPICGMDLVPVSQLKSPGVPPGSQRGTFKINANSNPKQITLVAPAPKKETLPGIYEFDGERLKLALIDEDYARPTNFDPDDRPDHMTLVLERVPVAVALNDEERQALKAAEAFLAVMDEGRFGQLRDMSSMLAKNQTTREQLSQTHQQLRDTAGKAESRSLQRVRLMDEFIGLPPGRYVAVLYRSDFEKQRGLWESVLLNVDDDGQWRVNTYAATIQPLPLPEPKKKSGPAASEKSHRPTSSIPPAAVPTGANLILDPSFENTALTLLPRDWRAWTNEDSDFRCEVVNGGHTGQRSLRISGKGIRGVVFGNDIKVDRSKRFALKGWAKFEGDKDSRAIIKFNYFRGSEYLGVHDLVGVTADQPGWHLFEKTDALDAYPQADHFYVMCHVEGSGSGWFDDLELLAYDRDKLPADFDSRHGRHNRLTGPNSLDRWVGAWETQYAFRESDFSLNETKLTMNTASERTLGDYFLLSHAKAVPVAPKDRKPPLADPQENALALGGEERLLFLTFDQNLGAFRQWFFSSNGKAFEWRGPWDDATKSLELRMLPDSSKLFSSERFVDADHIEAKLRFQYVMSMKDAGRWTATRKAPTAKVDVPAAKLRAAEPAELSQLDKFAGEWTIRAKYKPSVWNPLPREETIRETSVWILGGRFLMTRAFNEKNELTSIWIATYEPREKSNRFWFFNADGSSGQWRLTWDEPSSGFHFRAVDLPTGWSGTGFNRWGNEDSFDNQAVIKDENGRVLLDSTQERRRKK